MRIASWWLGVHNRLMDDGLDRGGTKDLRRLAPALKFLLPYKKQILTASFALVVTACATLLIGQGVRVLIDNGFGGGDGDARTHGIRCSFSQHGQPLSAATTAGQHGRRESACGRAGRTSNVIVFSADHSLASPATIMREPLRPDMPRWTFSRTFVPPLCI